MNGSEHPDRRHGFVVLAYGQSRFLEGCLASLKSQVHPSGMMIATSTPSVWLEDVARTSGIPLLVNPVRDRIGSDWNFALSQAPWPLVTLAHQDDLYLPNFSARTIGVIDRNSDAGLAFTGHGEIADAGQHRTRGVWLVKQVLSVLFAGRHERIEGLRRQLLLSFGNPIGCPTVTFNRTVLSDFRFDTELTNCLDWEAWWRLHLLNTPFVQCPARLVLRRYNEQSATWRGVRNGERSREDALMFNKIWPQPISTMLSWIYGGGYHLQ